MREFDPNLVREVGNEVMSQFEEVTLILENVLRESEKDVVTDGDESRKIAQKKYELLESSEEKIDNLKVAVLNLADLIGVAAETEGWEFPFDEYFKEVDIELDNQVVDRYFDINVRNAYQDILKTRKLTRDKLHAVLDGVCYACPCCGDTFFKRNGDYSICPVCKWENDRVQNDDPYYKGGANKECLSVAIQQYNRSHFI